MSKQRDALATLTRGSITERAEAARELGKSADAGALEPLVDAALGDKSPGVRLAAASAAADVLARYRLGAERGVLSDQRRKALHTRLRSLDPGRNSGLFQVLGCLGLPRVIRNIGRGVRDPRVDVRTGALVGLERLCVSGEVHGIPAVERTLRQLLAERRLRPAVSIELARVVYRAGLWQLRPEVEALAQRLEDRWQEEIQVVLDDLPAGLEPEALVGCWAEHGVDCGEHRAEPGPRQWLVIAPGRLLHGADTFDEHAWSLGEQGFTSPLLGTDEPVPARLLHTWFLGAEGVPVLQLGQRSFGRVDEKDLPGLLDALLVQQRDSSALASALLAALAPGLSEGAQGAYCMAVLTAWSGDPDAALERFESLTQSARCRPEAWWQLARLHDAMGRPDQAQACARGYLERAKKQSPFLAAATSRLEG